LDLFSLGESAKPTIFLLVCRHVKLQDLKNAAATAALLRRIEVSKAAGNGSTIERAIPNKKFFRRLDFVHAGETEEARVVTNSVGENIYLEPIFTKRGASGQKLPKMARVFELFAIQDQNRFRG